MNNFKSRKNTHITTKTRISNYMMVENFTFLPLSSLSMNCVDHLIIVLVIIFILFVLFYKLQVDEFLAGKNIQICSNLNSKKKDKLKEIIY